MLFFAIISTLLTFMAYRRTPTSYEADTPYNHGMNAPADSRTSSSVDMRRKERKADGVVTRENAV